MADGDIAVVAGRGEQRVPLVVLDGAESVGVVAQGLVGHAGQVQVEPEDLLVEGPDQEVVATRVDWHGGDPLGARH